METRPRALFPSRRCAPRQLLTFTSSGARRAASLTLTGATSSMVMAGRLDTTLISGTGWKRDNTWIRK